MLPENYRKILLSKDCWEERDGVEFVPYYQFIFENSVGRELFDSSLKINNSKGRIMADGNTE